MKTIIRKAEVKDAKGISVVHVKMWQKAYRGQVPDSYLDSLSVEARELVWKKSLEDNKEGLHILVAEIEGIITGWVSGGKNRDEDVTPETGELGGIYVHPDYAGMGIGSELMTAFLDILKKDGYKKATLWVLDTNEKTRRWYEYKGWKIEGRTKTEPRDGFDLHEVSYVIDL